MDKQSFIGCIVVLFQVFSNVTMATGLNELKIFFFFSGYFYTGDVARRTANGDYRILGSFTDLLNIDGEYIAAMEIEESIVCLSAFVVILIIIYIFRQNINLLLRQL